MPKTIQEYDTEPLQKVHTVYNMECTLVMVTQHSILNFVKIYRIPAALEG